MLGALVQRSCSTALCASLVDAGVGLADTSIWACPPGHPGTAVIIVGSLFAVVGMLGTVLVIAAWATARFSRGWVGNVWLDLIATGADIQAVAALAADRRASQATGPGGRPRPRVPRTPRTPRPHARAARSQAQTARIRSQLRLRTARPLVGMARPSLAPARARAVRRRLQNGPPSLHCWPADTSIWVLGAASTRGQPWLVIVVGSDTGASRPAASSPSVQDRDRTKT